MISTVFGSFTPQELLTLRGKWGWLLAFGLAICLLGILAFSNVVFATVASIYYVGATMLIAGVLQIAHAFQVRGAGPFLTWLIIGLVYALAGIVAFLDPLLASSFLTLLLAVSLLLAGGLRLASGLALRPAPSGTWLVTGGIVSLLAALLVFAGWPANSLWIVGLLLAIDLFLHGTALAVFALALRRTRGTG
jgi:uncharacterized membrane protein HdeD (DUF308 family)